MIELFEILRYVNSHTITLSRVINNSRIYLTWVSSQADGYEMRAERSVKLTLEL